MEFTEEELEDVCYGDSALFEDVVPEKIEDTDRWHNYFSKIIRNTSTGKLYEISWRVGATEYQDCDPDPMIVEVEPKEVTQTVYVKV